MAILLSSLNRPFFLTCEALIGCEPPERKKKKGANEGMHIEECTSLSVLIYPHLLLQRPKIVVVEPGFQIPYWINLFQACSM